MTRVIIVEKNGDLKSLNIKQFDKNDLYKKCNFKKPDHFECRTIWEASKKFHFKYSVTSDHFIPRSIKFIYFITFISLSNC